MGHNSNSLRAWTCRLLLLTPALGCGGAAGEGQTPLQPQAPASTQPEIGGATPIDPSNAPSLVVPMSMVLPKKPITPPAMTAPVMPQVAGSAGAPAMAPGAGLPMASTPAATGAAGAQPPGPMAAAAGSGSLSAAGADISGVPEAELAMLRDICVAEINMYRATLTDKMLMPLKRATPEQEECSQRAAKMDGDTMQGHGAFRAGLCSSVGLSAQNSCPGYPVGGFGGGTIADTLKLCLKQMWDEGEPPVAKQECIQDSTGCFLQHGHYLNMSDPNLGSVSCSFYKMMDGRNYWMSQDFAYSGGFGGWGMR